MKKSIRLLAGLFIFVFINSCTTERLTYNPVPEETPELEAAVAQVKEAFLKADTSKIRSMILPNYFGQYKAAIQGNESKLAEFGKLLKSMKIKAGDSIFVVYKVSYKGVEHEISFSADQEGKWKIMNF